MLHKLQLESVNELHMTIILTIVACVKMVWNSEEKEIKLLKHGKTVIAAKQAHIPVAIQLDKR